VTDAPRGETSHDTIVASGLTKSFGSCARCAASNLKLARSSTVALLGPNGAGKTTTIDMLIGLTQPDAGTVSLFGRSPRDAVKAGMIGAMTQTGQLIEYLSVRELVTMMAAIYPVPSTSKRRFGSRALRTLRNVKLESSRGETQRVRFAIALVADAELLVLDEPTVALDVEGRRDSGAPCAPSPLEARP